MLCYFCFKERAPTEIDTYLHTLSLHDALPICPRRRQRRRTTVTGGRLEQRDLGAGVRRLDRGTCTRGAEADDHDIGLQVPARDITGATGKMPRVGGGLCLGHVQTPFAPARASRGVDQPPAYSIETGQRECRESRGTDVWITGDG